MAAVVTALILLGVGWMGARHQAEVAHVRDTAGRIVHGHELADHHATSSTAHLHGRADHGHSSTCALLANLHAPIAFPAGVATVSTVSHASEIAVAIAPAPSATIASYRLAPKTSPPALG
ncbi:MAG: hypothetical protein H0X17_22870 [Deltaproteobacteria bacterium]|nr:hypothetical protein [Deltaproteobacteria bacterium]